MISNINNNILDYGKRESTSVRNNHTLLSLHLSFLFIPGSKFYVVLLPPKKKKKSRTAILGFGQIRFIKVRNTFA